MALLLQDRQSKDGALLQGVASLLVALTLIPLAPGCLLFGEHALLDKPTYAETFDPDNNTETVLLRGKPNNGESLWDTEFPVFTIGSKKLVRRVQMYQRVEDCNSKRKCNVRKKWSSKWHSVAHFRTKPHTENPKLPLQQAEWETTDFAMAGFKVKWGFEFDARKRKVPSTGEMRKTWEAKLGRKVRKDGRYRLYAGTNPKKPQVGDVRVWFEDHRYPGTVTVVGKQHDKFIRANSVLEGTSDWYDMQDEEQTEDGWIIRLLSLLGLALGFAALASALAGFHATSAEISVGLSIRGR